MSDKITVGATLTLDGRIYDSKTEEPMGSMRTLIRVLACHEDDDGNTIITDAELVAVGIEPGD